MYAPHTGRVKHDITELDDLYSTLNELVCNLSNISSSLLLMGGDFNAKIGMRTQDDRCLGRYSRGRRNVSGQQLVEFCDAHNLFIGNSSFQHPARHQTTWEQQRINKKTNKVVTIYNQIDYVIMNEAHKHTLVDARSYSGTNVDSDHRHLFSAE